MEPLTLQCPSCGRPLTYDLGRAGEPYECPRCGARGTLPGITLQAVKEDEPVEEEELEPIEEEPDPLPLVGGAASPPPRPVAPELLDDLLAGRTTRRQRARAWRIVRRGLSVLLVSWLAVAVLATVLLLVIFYRFLQFLLPLKETAPGPELAGALGLVMVLAESTALYGYRLCLVVPREEGLRDLVWVCLGLAVVRNVACLTASIAFFVVDEADVRAVGIYTIIGAGLFFGHWLIWLLLQRGLAYALREQWLMRMAQRIMALLAFILLTWSALWCGFFSATGGTQEGMARLGLVEQAWITVLFSCGGSVLTFLLWVAVVGQLRLLNFLRGVIAP
jgi:hypothetical protein